MLWLATSLQLLCFSQNWIMLILFFITPLLMISKVYNECRTWHRISFALIANSNLPVLASVTTVLVPYLKILNNLQLSPFNFFTLNNLLTSNAQLVIAYLPYY